MRLDTLFIREGALVGKSERREEKGAARVRPR